MFGTLLPVRLKSYRATEFSVIGPVLLKFGDWDLLR